ncbi:hypothetical protein Slin14017_G054970 [Septoria linicola]|nr:hypothetical protein Slin14017_G054970 [Septoria linicola]
MFTPAQEILYATSRMGPQVFVKYRNFTKSAERALRAETKRSSFAPTLLFKCLALEKEIEADKSLVRQAGMAGFQHVTALSFLRSVQLKACGVLRSGYADREELIGRCFES